MATMTDVSSDEEGQIQELTLPYMARPAPEPAKFDNPFLASESTTDTEYVAARDDQDNNSEVGPDSGIESIKREPNTSTLRSLLSTYESSPPVESDSTLAQARILPPSFEPSSLVGDQSVLTQEVSPPITTTTMTPTSTQSHPVAFSLPKTAAVKVEEQLPSFTNWKRRQVEAQYSRPPTRASREVRLVSQTPPPAASRPPAKPKADYYPARGPVSHYSPPPRQAAPMIDSGDYYRPESSGTSGSHYSPPRQARERLTPVNEPLMLHFESHTAPKPSSLTLPNLRQGSYMSLPRFSKERKGRAECELQNMIPDNFKLLPGTNSTSLWIGVVRYKRYLIGNTYTQFDKYFGPDFAMSGAISIGKLIRDDLTRQIPIGQNVWLSSDQRIGVMVEQQLMQIQALEAPASQADERSLKRRRQDDASTTDVSLFRGNAAVFQPSQTTSTKLAPETSDVQTALDAVKAQVARIAQVNDWDNPHAAAVWAQVICEDLKTATEGLQAALKTGSK